MIRPVPLALIRAVGERAKNVGLTPTSTLTRRAKAAAISAYAMHRASYTDALAQAHAVLGGIPLPMPPSGDAA